MKFKTQYLYIVPFLVIILGILIGRSEQALIGGATIAISFIVALALVIGIITYQFTKKLLWSILSVPVLFVILIIILNFIIRL